MNVILKAWRKFKLAVAKRRQAITVENKFQLGDWVHVKFGVMDQLPFDFDETGGFSTFGGTGEVVDAFYGFQMHLGYRWHYKVQYKRRDKVIVLYEEQEICIDAAWIRDKRLKELGI
jgi:hypothetical protein